MHTIEQLTRQLKEMGIQQGDLLTVHSSLKAVGETENRAEGVIEALRAAVKDGLLLIPAHTWKDVWTVQAYDVRASVPCIGTLPTVAVGLANRADRKGDPTIRRSLHPTHSVVAFGKTAREYIVDDESVETAIPFASGYGKLLTQNGKILLVGVGMNRNTFLHAVAEHLASKTLAQTEILVTDYDGKRTLRRMCPTHGDHEQFAKYIPAFEQAGALTYGKLGDADAILCDGKKCFDAALAYEKATKKE